MNLNTCNDEEWGQFVILDLDVIEPEPKPKPKPNVHIKMPGASLMRKPCKELSILKSDVDEPYIMVPIPLVSRCILHVVTGVTDVYNFISKL